MMLVVQALMSGLSLGARAASLDTDAFGGIICTTDAGKIADARSPGGSAPSHLVDCCTFGCSMVGGAVPMGPGHDCAFANPLDRVVAAIPTSVPLVAPVQRLPQNPRAPPGLS